MLRLCAVPLVLVAVTNTVEELICEGAGELTDAEVGADPPQLTAPTIAISAKTTKTKRWNVVFLLPKHKNVAGNNRRVYPAPKGSAGGVCGLGNFMAVVPAVLIVSCVASGVFVPSATRAGGLKLQFAEAGNPVQVNVWVPR